MQGAWFFPERDYYSLLVSKNLAAYCLNKKTRQIQVEILIDKWKQYLSNDRYCLNMPFNAEVVRNCIDLDNVLLGKVQQESNRLMYNTLRLGPRDSDSYESKLGKQRV